MTNFNKFYNEIISEKVKVTKKDRKRADKDTLKKGSDVEMEHTDSKDKAEDIAIQHMKEFPTVDTPSKLDSNYYKELEKMEKELSKSVKELKIKNK